MLPRSGAGPTAGGGMEGARGSGKGERVGQGLRREGLERSQAGSQPGGGGPWGGHISSVAEKRWIFSSKTLALSSEAGVFLGGPLGRESHLTLVCSLGLLSIFLLVSQLGGLLLHHPATSPGP